MDGLGPRGAPRPDMYHRGKSHEELKVMTDAGDPAASEDVAAQWRSMGDGLENAGELLQEVVFGSESGWKGQAADAMRYRLGEVVTWSTNTGKGFTAASAAVVEQSEAVGSAKTRMPEPVPYDPGQIFDEAMKGGLFGIMALPQRLHSQKQKHDAAYDEAVLVVAARDGQLAVGAATIPAFTAPPVFTDDSGVRPPDEPGRRPPGGGPDGGQGGFGRDPGGGAGGGFGPGPGGRQGPAGPRPGTDLGPSGPGPAGPPRPDPGVTVPGWHPTKQPGVGGPGSGLGQGAGPPGSGQDLGLGSGFLPGVGMAPGRGFGSGGEGSPGRGSGPGSGGPGRGSGGVPGTGGPGATAAGGRGAAGGARGAAGMGGMPMGAGGRGQGDEDSEHQRPTWLQEDDPDALFGTDERTAPPVIGGED